MRIPSSSVGALQQPYAADPRRARELPVAPQGTGGAQEEGTPGAARDDGRRRAGIADFVRVQRMDEADVNSGPGRSAVSLYLSVVRNSLPAGREAELVGVDVLV